MGPLRRGPLLTSSAAPPKPAGPTSVIGPFFCAGAPPGRSRLCRLTGALSPTISPRAQPRAAPAPRRARFRPSPLSTGTTVFPPPGRHAAVRAWLKDHRRRSAGDVPFSKLVGERSRHPPSPAALLRAAGLCPGDMAGLRDRCLLALSANGVPDPALIALDAEQLRSSHGGYELRLTNPDRTVPILPVGAAAAASSVCPVRALQDWLSASDCLFGPVFRKVDRWGNAEYRRLSAGGLRCIWRRRLGNARRRYGKASLA